MHSYLELLLLEKYRFLCDIFAANGNRQRDIDTGVFFLPRPSVF